MNYNHYLAYLKKISQATKTILNGILSYLSWPTKKFTNVSTQHSHYCIRTLELQSQTIGTYSALGVFRAAKHEKRVERNETRLAGRW